MWPLVAPILTPVIIQTADEEPEHVYRALTDGSAGLWVVEGRDDDGRGRLFGAFVGGVDFRPRIKALVIRYGAGERIDEWIGQAVDLVRIQAEALGCSVVDMLARPGMWKLLKSRGIDRFATVYRWVIR